MIIVDNINMLKENYKNARELLLAHENLENEIKFQIEDAKKNGKTLYYKVENKKRYIHSKYDSIKEADLIVKNYDNIRDGEAIIFYGTGLGYHIEKILEKYPNSRYYILEPYPNMMNAMFSNINFKNLYKNRLVGMTIGKFNVGQSIEKFLDENKKGFKIVELPAHINHFPENYKSFKESLKKVLESKLDSLATDYSFQERWIMNSIKNFKYVLKTPNILKEKRGAFYGKTAFLVAAGPSLNYEIENLKRIKKDNMGYIFSVGSAINTLLYHGIYPDIVASYDPKIGNQKVLEIIKNENITDIPLLFGSSIGYETIENYPGKMTNVITSQDSVSNYYLSEDLGDQVALVQDASSIAVITLQILEKLGFSRIVFIGQNLAFQGNKQHSEGITYSKNITESEMEKALVVEDVYGNEIRTNEGYNSMRRQIEYYISLFKDKGIEFINTTKNGAKIEGTEFMNLDELIENVLIKGNKDILLLEDIAEKDKNNYNLDSLKNNREKMGMEFNNIEKIIRDYHDVLEKIDRLTNNGNFKQLENMYAKQDEQLRKLENNDFYKTFILPMNRVQYKFLVDNIDNLNSIKNPLLKGKKVYREFKVFILGCEQTKNSIKEMYLDMDKDIIDFLEKKEA